MALHFEHGAAHRRRGRSRFGVFSRSLNDWPGPWWEAPSTIGARIYRSNARSSMTEKMPSSVSEGSRPRICSRRWYSSPLKPCSAMTFWLRLALVLASMGLWARRCGRSWGLIAGWRALVAPPQRLMNGSQRARLSRPSTPAAVAAQAGRVRLAGDRTAAQCAAVRPRADDLEERRAQRRDAAVPHDFGAAPADPGPGGAGVRWPPPARRAQRPRQWPCHSLHGVRPRQKIRAQPQALEARFDTSPGQADAGGQAVARDHAAQPGHVVGRARKVANERKPPRQMFEAGERPAQEPMVLARDHRADRNEVQDRAARATRQGARIDPGRGDDDAIRRDGIVGAQDPRRTCRGGDHRCRMAQSVALGLGQTRRAPNRAP